MVRGLLFARVAGFLEELLLFDGEASLYGSPLSCGKQFRDLVERQLLQLVERVTTVGELTFVADLVFRTHSRPPFPPRPVRLEAMSPTFRPGGASREILLGLPGCCRPPPPKG